MMALLVLFGGAISAGGLLNSLSLSGAVYAGLAIFAIRPLLAWISLSGTTCPPTERAAISFFGIRGIGTIYYLAFAFQKASFDGAEKMWSISAAIVLTSIVLHGVTVTPVMMLIDRRRKRGQTAREEEALAAEYKE